MLMVSWGIQVVHVLHIDCTSKFFDLTQCHFFTTQILLVGGKQ